MAVTTTSFQGIQSVHPPDYRAIVALVLSALPGAAMSTEPPPSLLPILSPILRQRVQLLSSASTEPWIRLLTYDTASVPKLKEIAQNGVLEPHPVSGEIELDFDYNVHLRYRRIDQETLQTLVVLDELGLSIRLVHCMEDNEGVGDGWRVRELGVAGAGPSSLGAFGGAETLGEVEALYRAECAAKAKQVKSSAGSRTSGVVRLLRCRETEGDDDDNDYWARYDTSPTRTPAAKDSQMSGAANQVVQNGTYRPQSGLSTEEDDYYARYDSIQPAMDDLDHVEKIRQPHAAPPLGLARPPQWDQAGPDHAELSETNGAWNLADSSIGTHSPSARSGPLRDDEHPPESLVHPRPSSSASSNGPLTIARLEETAERREQTEFSIKKHVARSIRSLFLLSLAAGIDRDEFEQMVKAELAVLGLVEDSI